MGNSLDPRIGREELQRRFGYHTPDSMAVSAMEQIRAGCLQLAELIDELCPASREKSDSLTNLDYVMYQANAALARRSGLA